MIRLFNQHTIRSQRELEGYWEFTKSLSKDTLPATLDSKMYVPGCWESDIELCDYRGYGVYKKTVFLEKEENLRLNFKGVSHTADVFFNGVKVANHYNAFTEFSIILPNTPKGKHELILLVDNTFNEDSSLHLPNDYYSYGGIIRPAIIEYVSDVYIKNLKFTPYESNGQWHATVTLTLENISDTLQKTRVELNLDQSILESHALNQWIQIGPNQEVVITGTISFDDVLPWSDKSPNLYLFQAKLYLNNINNPVDDLIERVGFRTIQVQGKQLLLNEKPIFVQGFNRHEDFNITGSSIPMQLAAVDMNLMTNLGSNGVRTSHYPNDERFLDMCDEKGILVWEENHARGLNIQQMLHPNFEKQCEDCNKEMVESHYNHPSIIIWGILNECASDTQEGRDIYTKQFNQIKSIDQSRPLTFATCRHFSDICLDLVDIVSLNLYPGWYDEAKGIEGVENAYMKELDWIQTTGGKDKPIIISEFGAGAIYGYRAPHRPKWSEERQSDILGFSLKIYLNRPEIIGTFIWQLADCRVTEEIWGITRPRTQNNKGIVDEYRRPKLAYETVKGFYENNTKVY